MSVNAVLMNIKFVFEKHLRIFVRRCFCIYEHQLSFILNTEAERELEKGKRKPDCFRFPSPTLFPKTKGERRKTENKKKCWLFCGITSQRKEK